MTTACAMPIFCPFFTAIPVSYLKLRDLEHTSRVGGSSIVGSYRDDTGTIASSFDDPIGCYFMASSAT